MKNGVETMEDKEKKESLCKDSKAFFICISGYEDRIPKGTLYLGATGCGFRGTMAMLELMSRAADCLCGEKAELRSFSENAPVRLEQAVETDKKSAAIATFRLEIIFCRGNDWQGKIKWLEQDREECFRSGLELLRLIDSAFDE